MPINLEPINHLNDHLCARNTDFNQLAGQAHAMTSLVYESPTSDGYSHWPVPRAENADPFRRCEAAAEALAEVTFVGRLATYKYNNIGQVVAKALTTLKCLVKAERPAHETNP